MLRANDLSSAKLIEFLPYDLDYYRAILHSIPDGIGRFVQGGRSFPFLTLILPDDPLPTDIGEEYTLSFPRLYPELSLNLNEAQGEV